MSDDTPLESRSWWRPGLSEQDIEIWEAAERCANAAPEIRPGDQVAIRLQQLYRGFPDFLRARRAEQAAKADNPAA